MNSAASAHPRVLVLGASGLVGRHLMRALADAGVSAVGASYRAPHWRRIDMARMTQARDWLDLVAPFDTVINCVGILREQHAGQFDTLQRAAPCALFDACAQLGGRRLIQISALGSAPDADSDYWRSKGAAEQALRASGLDYTIVRPSLVYAPDGVSSAFFLSLASLPLLPVPLAHSALVQPIHIDDLCAGLVRLVQGKTIGRRQWDAVGPRALTIGAYLAALRDGMQAPPAKVVNLPLALAAPLARVAGAFAASPLTPATLHMLAACARGAGQADPAQGASLLGRPQRDPSMFSARQQLAGAVMTWAVPALRVAMALVWLVTAYVSWFVWPHAQSAHWLQACGVPAVLAEPTLLAASVLDGVIGLALLLRPRRWLWAMQLALVAAYTVLISIYLPEHWAHPYGPISKNLPILVVLALMWRLHRKPN